MRKLTRALIAALVIAIVLPVSVLAYWPVGTRSSYISTGYSRSHPALDIAAPSGTKVVPIRTGRTVFAGYKQLLRSIDSQALATARRDLTPYDAAQHLPWPILGDGTVQPVAPADWLRLDSADREAKTWKDWRKEFHDRYLSLQVRRTLAGLGAKK